MKKKNTVLLKNIGLFMIGNIGAKILSFLLVPLYTYVLSTEEYGTADLLITTVSLITPLLTLSITDAILRYSMDERYNPQDIISSAINILWKSSIILFVFLIVFYRLNLFDLKISHYIFIFISYVLNISNNMFNLYLKGKNDVSTITVSGILNTVIMCTLNILFLVVYKWGLNGYLLANILGILSAVIYQFIFGKIYYDIQIHVKSNITKDMILYSLPLIPNSLAWWINSASDRYFILFLKGVSENGIYSLAYKIPTMLSIMQTIFYNAWSISAIKDFDQNDSDGFFGSNYSLYSSFCLFICSGLILFNIPLAKILYSEKFLSAWRCVPFLLIGTMFNGLSLFEGCIYASVKKTKIVSLTTMVGALCNTICNIIFINCWGGVGAAFATMIGYFVTWSLRTIFMRKIIFMKVNWKAEIIGYMFLLLQSFIALLISNYLFQIIIIIILFLLHRKNIQKALTNF